MAKKIDRALQRKMLEQIARCYPRTEIALFKNASSEEETESMLVNLTYLKEHGLIEGGVTTFLDGSYAYSGAKMTANGMDFLEEDGGLTAILGVVTVRLHDDTVRSLIENRIMSSDLNVADKKRLLDQLRELPGESIKHLTMKLLDAGLENWPKALPAIQTVLGAFP